MSQSERYCRHCNAGVIFKREITTKQLNVFRCSHCPAGEWDNRNSFPLWAAFKAKERFEEPEVAYRRSVAQTKGRYAERYKESTSEGFKPVSGGLQETPVGESEEVLGETVRETPPSTDPVQRMSEPHLPGLGDPEDWPT